MERTALDRLLRDSAGRLRLGWRLVLFFVLAVAISVVLSLVLPPGTVTGSAAVLAGSVAAGALLLSMDGRGPRSLGFHLDRAALGECGLGLGLGVALGLVVVAIMALLGGLRWSSDGGTVVGWLAGALGALAFLAVPAAAEEALLRGYPLQALAEAWGPWWGLAITSIAFGAMHLPNPGVTPIAVANVTIAGLFLGVVYLRTASLWWATGAHLGWNWAHGYLADVPVSGLELMDAPFYEGMTRGAPWLGGGTFGPEGSLVATVTVLAASLWCWRAGWLRPGPAAIAAEPLVLIQEGGR